MTDKTIHSDDNMIVWTLRALANTIRLEILQLTQTSGLPQSTLAKRLGVSESSISQHITILQNAELVDIEYLRGSRRKYVKAKYTNVNIQFPSPT